MKKIASALLLSAAISAPAFAADANTGYVALDYGTWSMSNVAPLPNPGALTFSGGYYFTPNVGVEAGFVLVGDSTVTYPGGQTTYSQSAVKVAAVGTVPVAPQLDIFGKLGFDSISGTLSQTGFADQSASTGNLMFGIGAQYNFDKQIGMRVQYESLGKSKASSTGTSTDITMFSIGVVFHF